MRILMIAPRLPYPATFGAAQRNFHILRWLGWHHEVTLVAFGDRPDEETSKVLRDHAGAVTVVPMPARSALTRARDLAFSTHPDLTRRLWSREMVDAIDRKLRATAFDLVQIEGLEMFSLWLAAARANKTRPRVVLDEHNAESALQASVAAASWRGHDFLGGMYSSIQALRLRRYERLACAIVDGVVAVSKDDESTIRALRPGIRSTVVPNGVDTTDFVPGPRTASSDQVLFIGKMDYRPNVDAVEWLRADIWPRVRRELPSAILNIVGRDPLPRVRRLGGSDGVTVVGEVADERPWFHNSDVLAVPMRMGSGVRLKVLQAMATATPIVSTTLGMSGVTALDGTHFLRADGAASFAANIVTALRDDGLRRRLALESRALVQAQYDWQVILPRLDAFHRDVVDND